jgi:hypothetical protein
MEAPPRGQCNSCIGFPLGGAITVESGREREMVTKLRRTHERERERERERKRKERRGSRHELNEVDKSNIVVEVFAM